jgi:hypothetical protein
MQTKSFVHLRREDLRRAREKKEEKGEQGNKEHPSGKKPSYCWEVICQPYMALAPGYLD